MTAEFQRQFLEKLYELGYKYLVTNVDGSNIAYIHKPKKLQGDWYSDTFSGEVYLPFRVGLISREDTEPKSIAEILRISGSDWLQIPVDTKIFVSEDCINWYKRHFAKYENGRVYAWADGLTSWTAENYSWWEYAKLAEE